MARSVVVFIGSGFQVHARHFRACAGREYGSALPSKGGGGGGGGVRCEHTLVRPALTIAALLAVGALVLVTFMGGNGSWTGAGVGPMSV